MCVCVCVCNKWSNYKLIIHIVTNCLIERFLF